MPSSLLRARWAGLIALAASGCGPIGATSVISDAEVAVARAHAADGDKHAIYETTSADLYLAKAREEDGHAQYGAARELAKTSIAFAEAAAKKAAESRTAAPVAPAPPATIGHPDGAPKEKR